MLSNRSNNTIGNQVIRVKDKVDKEGKSDVIYQINCQDCDCKYVGESGRMLRDRIEEHKFNVIKKVEQSQVY